MSNPELKYLAWKNIERERLNPQIDREMVVGDKIMLARVLMKRVRTFRCITITTSKSPISRRGAEIQRRGRKS